VAVTPDGRKVHVANAGDNTVSVIDTGTNAVSTITDPSFNHPVAFGVFIAPLVVQLAPLSGTGGNVAMSDKRLLIRAYWRQRTRNTGPGPAYPRDSPQAISLLSSSPF
jgi:YVTN family beta-propeller protein